MIIGTRGIIGITSQGTTKTTYNQYDSYPDWLGRKTAEWLRGKLLMQGGEWILHPEVEGMLARLKAVDEHEKCPPEILAEMKERGVWEQVSSGDDWYSALRGAQGDLDAYVKLGYLPDAKGFALDSLFCEYGYVIDADARTLDVYEGFQQTPATEGVWAGQKDPGEEYYPINRVLSIPFAKVASEDLDALVADMDKACGD